MIEADGFKDWVKILRSAGYQIKIAEEGERRLPSGVVRKDGREVELAFVENADGSAAVFVGRKNSGFRDRKFVDAIVKALMTEGSRSKPPLQD